MTEVNGDEGEYGDEFYPVSFTKGLPHDELGILVDSSDYCHFISELNQQDATDMKTVRRGIGQTDETGPSRPALTERKGKKSISWRGWDSPRAGHYFDLQGPDVGEVSIPQAPEFGSEELIAEMAEIYAMALLRDVPIKDIIAGIGEDKQTRIRTADVLDSLANLSWFAEIESPLSEGETSILSLQERRRRAARRIDHGAGFDVDNPPGDTPFNKEGVFRGSGPGAKAGPFVSQFMLLGTKMDSDADGTACITSSKIEYGAQLIDQKTRTFTAHQDYMLHWNAAVDVQNGADFSDDNTLTDGSRFIVTPRDLAAYVRYDALYQTYLNACLFILRSGDSFDTQKSLTHPYTHRAGPGFPDRGKGESRNGNAFFGDSHVLSLIAEVAPRCLKAAQRQNFNYHRRSRPERIGELLTLHGTRGESGGNDVSGCLGSKTMSMLTRMASAENLGALLTLVARHNSVRMASDSADPHLDFDAKPDPAWFHEARNLLIPMAFADGSPMNPSYGAGHATVAGGCVTMLKAFFHTVERDQNNRAQAVAWPDALPVVESSTDGSALRHIDRNEKLTIGGELNKLAANISTARSMAGIHFYSDYYESIRMGERVATGLLIEQMKQYNEPVEMDFESFDGDHVHILKVDYDSADSRVFVHDTEGKEVVFDDWWTRHVVSSSDADYSTHGGDEPSDASVESVPVERKDEVWHA